MSKKVYIFLADGFEDIEGLTVVDLLRRAGVDIRTVSIKNTKEVQTAHGICLLTDEVFGEVDFSDADTGEYIVGKNATDSKKYYAYNVSTYTLYTVRDTGIADVYLDGSQADGAITVTSNGQQLDDKVAKSMRIGISTVDKNGNETLRFVYAPSEPTGYGNDLYSKNNSITGWITVSNETSTKNATYSHIYAKNYIDQNSKNWEASKDGKSFIKPVSNASPIASRIDYNGIILKVYVLLEGTDSDCINTAANVVNEDLSYDVTLHMVGVNSDN